MSYRRYHFFLDRPFQLALAAGPVTWLVLYLSGALSSLHPIEITAWLVMSFCLFYPILEELVFRGILQKHLYEYRWGKTSYIGISHANLTTSAAFICAHLIHQPIEWAILVALPSLIFGICRDKYQSVIPGMILHIVYNSGFLLTRYLSV